MDSDGDCGSDAGAEWVWVRRPSEARPLKVVFSSPASYFTDAAPIGNGRLGAMVWGGVESERLQLNPATSFEGPFIKTLGLSETVFEVTRKEQQGGAADGGGGANPGRFTFDSSPVFVPPTAPTVLTLVAIAVGAWRAIAGAAGQGVPDGGPGVGEFVCCGWLVLCFWQFVRGLAGKGSYGIPWSVKIKAGLLVAAFVHFCTRN